ncbi:MAG: HNH endonuclease [Rhodospirillales bacterium]
MPEKLSGKDRIGAFLRQNIGKVVTSKQIQAASGGHVEHAHRVRDLRNDDGWNISTHNSRADLKPGEYVLEEEPPPKGTHKRPRRMSKRVKAEVYERDGYGCRMCGIGARELTEDGRPARLQIGHVKDRAHGGTDDMDNLRVLCSDCNEGSKHLLREPPSASWLIGRVRTASRADQRAVWKFLQGVFKDEKEKK